MGLDALCVVPVASTTASSNKFGCGLWLHTKHGVQLTDYSFKFYECCVDRKPLTKTESVRLTTTKQRLVAAEGN